MLTKKRKQILDYIENFIKKRRYSPSLEEIRKHFRLASRSTAHYYIELLKKKGYINKLDYQARAIELLKEKEIAKLVEIPIIGIIAAGQPIEAIDNPVETISVNKSEVGKFGKLYALRVQGNSMIDDGIFDGDIVIIRKQDTADDGQTIVAIIDDNQATLKKIYREKEWIKLQPANQAILPIYRKEVEVRGVVVKLLRNLENGVQNNNNTFSYRKKAFLDRIKSSNPDSQNKYKRVVLSTIRYAGGKFGSRTYH